MADDMEPVGLLQLDTPEWRLWAAIAELSSYLKAQEWVLIGGAGRQVVVRGCLRRWRR